MAIYYKLSSELLSKAIQPTSKPKQFSLAQTSKPSQPLSTHKLQPPLKNLRDIKKYPTIFTRYLLPCFSKIGRNHTERLKFHTQVPRKKILSKSPLVKMTQRLLFRKKNFPSDNYSQHVTKSVKASKTPRAHFHSHQKAQVLTASCQKSPKFILESTKFSLLTKIKSAPLKLIPASGGHLKSLFKDFTYEFHLTISEVDLSSSGILNYSKFCSVLNKLRFIEDYFNKSEEERELVLKAWKILGGLEENKVRVDYVYLFLLAILNIKFKLDKAQPLLQGRRIESFMSKKNILRYHQEFLPLYLKRMYKRDNLSFHSNEPISSPEETISDEDAPQIIIDSAPPQEAREINEIAWVNISYRDNLLASKSHKIIRRISLRELSATPKNFNTKQPVVHQTGQSICESPKNLSFNSETEENLHAPLLLTPTTKSEGKSQLVNTIKIQKIVTMRNDLNSSKIMVNNSSMHKGNSMKFKFPVADSNENSRVLFDISREL